MFVYAEVELAMSKFASASVTKRVLVQNWSCENEFDIMRMYPLENIFIRIALLDDLLCHRKKAICKWPTQFTFLRKDGHLSKFFASYQWHF